MKRAAPAVAALLAAGSAQAYDLRHCYQEPSHACVVAVMQDAYAYLDAEAFHYFRPPIPGHFGVRAQLEAGNMAAIGAFLDGLNDPVQRYDQLLVLAYERLAYDDPVSVLALLKHLLLQPGDTRQPEQSLDEQELWVWLADYFAISHGDFRSARLAAERIADPAVAERRSAELAQTELLLAQGDIRLYGIPHGGTFSRDPTPTGYVLEAPFVDAELISAAAMRGAALVLTGDTTGLDLMRQSSDAAAMLTRSPPADTPQDAISELGERQEALAVVAYAQAAAGGVDDAWATVNRMFDAFQAAQAALRELSALGDEYTTANARVGATLPLSRIAAVIRFVERQTP